MHDFKIGNLVLDAAPLLSTAASSSAANLRNMAQNFITTPDVVAEIRDKTSRELFSATLQMLGLSSAAPAAAAAAGGAGTSAADSTSTTASPGLQVREATAHAIAKVTAFAKLTGDIAVLSQADIRVLALTYALEVQLNGTRRLRDAPGKLSQEEQERENKRKERLAAATASQGEKSVDAPVAPSSANRDSSSTSEKDDEDVPVASTSRLSLSSEIKTAEHGPLGLEDCIDGGHMEEQQSLAAAEEPKDGQRSEQEHGDGTASESDDDEDAGEWITPDNVKLHQSKDLGLFPDLPTSVGNEAGSDRSNAVQGSKGRAKVTTIRVACLTGDYAMQNVALQMGLNVFGVGGKKIKDIKTWVLRCHACFKICKDPTRKFCPSCGNPALIRTSITYVTPSPEHPQGYILHLKANFQYRNRGTQYSIPSPKPGSSNALKNAQNGELILREDQKEWVRGVRRAEVAKNKQEKSAAKAMRDGRGPAIFGGMSFDDPEWQPEMLLGDKGRHGGPAGAPIGKDGLPIIGYGRRNPNATRGGRRK